MKKVVIAPDSFKGTSSATEVCEIISSALIENYPDIEITQIPIADGGEGTVDAYLHIFSGKRKTVTVKSPLGGTVDAEYGILSDKTAVIEMAAASGITIEKENNAMLASSYGTGQLILDALNEGAKKIILGLGGSATTDGGAGCLSALGARLFDKDGNEIPPGGAGLEKLCEIDTGRLDKRLFQTELCVLCDVENPLYGKNGAAYVYSRQKGANDEEIKKLDCCLKRLAVVSEKALGKDFSHEMGAGAAGGMGFCCIAFLGGELKRGIDFILDAADFENTAKSADLVITGEGKMDRQSLMGKAPFGVAKRSGKTRVIAVVGLLVAGQEDVKKAGIDLVIETDPLHRPFEQVKLTAKDDLKKAAALIRL